MRSSSPCDEQKGDVQLDLNVEYLNITISISSVLSDDACFVVPYNLVLFFLTRLCKIITVEKILPNLIFVVN